MALPNVPKALQDGVQMSLVDPVKPDKTEPKLVSFTSSLINVKNCRTPAKIELTVHFLQILSVESKSSDQLTLVLDNGTQKPGDSRTLHLRASHSDSCDRSIVDEILAHIVLSLKFYFPECELSFIPTMDVAPASRVTAVNEAVAAVADKEPGPCGGFSNVYRFMCDYHRLPFRDEVVWDVDTIYLSQSCRELCLTDFDHLEGRDLVPIISALRYNTWFTKLNATDTKLVVDAMSEIIQLVKVNKVLEEIHISNIGAKFDFANRLATAVTANEETSVQVLDISHNVIDDRGVTSLAQGFAGMSRGLVRLNMANCSLSGKDFVAELVELARQIFMDIQTPHAIQPISIEQATIDTSSEQLVTDMVGYNDKAWPLEVDDDLSSDKQ